MIICTLATASHLPLAKVLANSIKRHHPDAHVVLGFMEKTWRENVRRFHAFDKCVLAKDMNVPEFGKFMFTRKAHEASYALKGHFLKYLLHAYPNENDIVYLDSDIYVLGRMTEVEQALVEHPIVLTPHLLNYVDDTFLRTGLFNAGFIAIRRSNDTDRFLDWWISRKDRYCYDDQRERGAYHDQNWLNLAPLYFDVYSLHHPGYNAGFWNLKERPNIDRLAKGHYQIEGQPLKLFHFSGLYGGLKSTMDRYIGGRNNGMYRLRNYYVKQLNGMRHRRLRKLRWSYDYYDNGRLIGVTERLNYRDHPELQLKSPNPFQMSKYQFHRPKTILKDRNLRIVQVISNSPNALPLPPVNQGGTEKVVYEVTEELVRRGHEVYLYAAKGSKSSAIVKPYPTGIREGRIAHYVSRTLPKGVDVIHDHSFRSSIGRGIRRIPTVSTRHMPYRKPASFPVYVSRRALQVTGKNRGAFVYNGINLKEYQFSEQKHDYLLFIGRIIREKGIMHAIDVADRTGLRLIIAGPIKNQELFRKEIEPRMRRNPRIKYAGAVGGQRKQDLLKHARCVLFPSIWEEPFGLVMVEAMACGTPVFALNNGAVSEVLAGFPNLICRTINEMAHKVLHEPMPSPHALREYVEHRFTTEKMVDRYLQIYQEAIARKYERTRSNRKQRVLKGKRISAKRLKLRRKRIKPLYKKRTLGSKRRTTTVARKKRVA